MTIPAPVQEAIDRLALYNYNNGDPAYNFGGADGYGYVTLWPSALTDTSVVSEYIAGIADDAVEAAEVIAAAVAAAEDARDDAIAAKDLAEAAATSAGSSASTATAAASAAGSAEDGAVLAQGYAEDARDAAAASESAASGHSSSASASASAASGSASAASGSASTASGAATAAQGYRDTALTYRNDAQTAASAAADSADLAEYWALQAEAIVGGGVTSVALAGPASFSISGSPVTSTGTLTFAYAAGYGPFSDTQSGKLAGIASGATANQTDSYLLDRANHTGTQAQSTVVNLTTDLAARLPLGGGTMTGFIVLHADPSLAMHPATKQYVDTAVTSLARKFDSVRVATTANITISTALNNGDTLDGITLATGDLVLVKNQSTASQNGVYVVGVTPVRATSFDTWDEIVGIFITVQQGTANAETGWLCTADRGGTLGTTAINFIQANLFGSLLAANNLSDLANAAAARDNLGVEIGVDVQPYDADTAFLDVDQLWTGAQRATASALTSGTTITPAAASGNDFTLTLAHNATLANFSDIGSFVGQKGTIAGQQDGTGGFTLAYGSYWFPVGAATAPAIPTGANAKFRIDYHIVNSTRIDFAVVSVGV